MQIPKEISSPVNKALYRLSMGDLTCGEMMAYLTDKKRKNTGFEPEVAERVVAFLVENGFLDDKRYLKLMVGKLDRAYAGPRKIRQTLVRHLFPSRYVEAALARRVDYSTRAKRFLKEKLGERGIATPAEQKKWQDFLVRQGYDFATARDAVSVFFKQEDDCLE